jgi:hypothetical protein
MVTKDNVRDIDKIADFFAKKLRIKSMSFNYPHYTLEDTPANTLPMNLYAKKIIELYEYSKKHHVIIYQIDRYLSTIFKKIPYIVSCK